MESSKSLLVDVVTEFSLDNIFLRKKNLFDNAYSNSGSI
jgi:hypothetical protein